MLIPRKAGFVASVNVAPNEALIIIRHERRKPVLSFQNTPNTKHGQPLVIIYPIEFKRASEAINVVPKTIPTVTFILAL